MGPGVVARSSGPEALLSVEGTWHHRHRGIVNYPIDLAATAAAAAIVLGL